MRKSLTLAAVLAFSTALTSLPLVAQDTATAEKPAPATPEGGASAVVATVNGTDITLGHMIVLRENLPAQYQSLPDKCCSRAFWTS